MLDRSARELIPPDTFTRLVTDFLPQIIRITDAGGGALYLNVQWERYTGRTVANSLDLGWQRALHPEDLPHFQGAWAAGVTTETAFVIEYRLQRADGV